MYLTRANCFAALTTMRRTPCPGEPRSALGIRTQHCRRRMWWKELRSRGSANQQMLATVWKKSVAEMDEHFYLTEHRLSSQFSCSCAVRLHLWNASGAKMMEVWNTETENAKGIIGLSRCLVICIVNAMHPILLRGHVSRSPPRRTQWPWEGCA